MPGIGGYEVNLGQKVTYQGFYDFISRAKGAGGLPYINDKTIIGSDASMNYFGTMLLKVGAARGYFAQPSYSSIAYVGPAATGVCLAKGGDQRVVVFTGDGGFQMTALCVVTQARFGLNPIIFVIDNGVFAVEQWLADASVFSSPTAPFKAGLDVYPCSYSAMPAVVPKCKGWRAETYGDLEKAMTDAWANLNGPSIIQVIVPSKPDLRNAKWKAKLDMAKKAQ